MCSTHHLSCWSQRRMWSCSWTVSLCVVNLSKLKSSLSNWQFFLCFHAFMFGLHCCGCTSFCSFQSQQHYWALVIPCAPLSWKRARLCMPSPPAGLFGAQGCVSHATSVCNSAVCETSSTCFQFELASDRDIVGHPFTLLAAFSLSTWLRLGQTPHLVAFWHLQCVCRNRQTET